MEKVFPEQMETIDTGDKEKCISIFNDYIRYMTERIEFSFRNIAKIAGSSQSLLDWVLRLQQLETDVTQLSTKANNALSQSSTAVSRSDTAVANSENALENTQQLQRKAPFIADGIPGSSTIGSVGQICVYDGNAYICTSNEDQIYTWKEI